MSPSGPEDVRRFIDRGLERYRRGEFIEALAEWEHALRVSPENLECQRLVTFVRQLISSRKTPIAVAALRTPQDKDPTNPEVDEETVERVRRAERSAAQAEAQRESPSGSRESQRRLRDTISSPISSLLAPITAPGWSKSLTSVTSGVPSAPMEDTDTRKLGAHLDHATPASGRRVPDFAEEPSADPARGFRVRAADFVDRCRAELANRQPRAAALAAENALRESEAAPPPGIAEVIEPARLLFESVFAKDVGSLQSVPILTMPPEQLAVQDFDHRAGFLISRMDGLLTVEQIIDVAAMPRFDSLRIISGLIRVGAVRML